MFVKFLSASHMFFLCFCQNTQEAWEIGDTDDEDSDFDNESDGMILDSGYTNEVDDLNNPGLSDDDQASFELINSDQETDMDSVMMVRISLFFLTCDTIPHFTRLWSLWQS